MLRDYVIAISRAVRGGQFNVACGPFLFSYLYRGFDISARVVRLVQGVICRTYFRQFALNANESELRGKVSIKRKCNKTLLLI